MKLNSLKDILHDAFIFKLEDIDKLKLGPHHAKLFHEACEYVLAFGPMDYKDWHVELPTALTLKLIEIFSAPEHLLPSEPAKYIAGRLREIIPPAAFALSGSAFLSAEAYNALELINEKIEENEKREKHPSVS